MTTPPTHQTKSLDLCLKAANARTMASTWLKIRQLCKTFGFHYCLAFVMNYDRVAHDERVSITNLESNVLYSHLISKLSCIADSDLISSCILCRRNVHVPLNVLFNECDRHHSLSDIHELLSIKLCSHVTANICVKCDIIPGLLVT